ncbi:PREDICTED: ras association domain-containing protein 9 [Nanorana parkeri]|uniref:ras association domain-containing protein 9 n=1 Tax=Nanorana parkeri TaxID=125878 RepID=UPI0008546D67|nr:PREDICTED: ras association domain-containing protein 9 [Nanorana parkeri]
MEPRAGYIVVWVGQEEKIVCGLTKHTISADVVQAVLEEQQTVMGNKHVQLGNPKQYYITGKWRGFQCTLPPTTKMLKLWKAWGAEQVNVSFFLEKSELKQPCLMWNTAEYHTHTNCPHQSTASVIKSFPLHKQKNIVRRAFRKLEEIKKGMDLQEKHSIKKFAPVITSQNLTIKKQIHRILELDEQIEKYMPYLHLDKEDEDEHSAHCRQCHLKEGTFKQQRCKFLLDKDSLGELLYIKDETNSPFMHTEILSNEIKEETDTMPKYQWEDLCAGEENLNQTWDMCMLQTLRQAVEESLQVEVKLHSLLCCMQKEICYHDSVLLRQKREYDVLKQELKLLNESNHLVTYESPQSYNQSVSTGNSEELTSDTDSDTGISSTYSQNSDPVL